jgi:hypothetical protein
MNACPDPLDLHPSVREIPFTQHLLPHGRTKPTSIAVAADVADKADAILARGLAFECEILSTGEVSLTVTDPEEGDDLAIEVLRNGPGVREAVERLIREFPLEEVSS